MSDPIATDASVSLSIYKVDVARYEGDLNKDRYE
ncbi:hypothetical protein SAMN05216339_101424 [Nitrosomonas eutropha]|uniref:Uncharacterized protein n=1 Tax=Nitrosomonas eutropha TaxID=916 RepID=A0A1I7FDC4_9PROT|nr:hypothetical protein SAMN05216339_101424 [Nitrosomonas eutropha]